MKLKSYKLQQDDTESKALKDKVDIKYIIPQQNQGNCIVKLTDDLEHIQLVAHNGKKAPKNYMFAILSNCIPVPVSTHCADLVCLGKRTMI